MRTFIGMDLTGVVREALALVRSEVETADARWRDCRWVPPQNLHVTLKFTGELDAEQLERLVSVADGALGEMAAPLLTYDRVRAVPGSKRASMLWAVFEDTEDRAACALRAIDDAVATMGIEPETRAFNPHVTLVRARRPTRLLAEALDASNTAVDAALAGDSAAVSLPSAIVYKSTLTPRGAVYEKLAILPFGR
ncbi:MAG: RNA 2',3'-cyclic phosphodiesterase [Coriobacteriia bacterium]|nr:RNA 2',3'-cyclic phosphodiesterase [Coriobacteriia bacterium]